MLYFHASKACTLDEKSLKALFEDEFGYGLRTYEKRLNADWAKLKADVAAAAEARKGK